MFVFISWIKKVKMLVFSSAQKIVPKKLPPERLPPKQIPPGLEFGIGLGSRAIIRRAIFQGAIFLAPFLFHE